MTIRFENTCSAIQRPRRTRSRPRTRRAVVLAVICSFTWLVLVPSRAPATIQEQRARLPPPAFCEDEVVGIWRSHSYWQGHHQWYIFTLEIRRMPGDPDRLAGTVLSEFWDGGPDQEQPPQCGPGGYHQLVRMPGAGNIVNGIVTFGGTSWTVERSYCGLRTRSYYPDSFSGRIDPEIQEFQSVNNDGGPAVNVPQVFRRIRCLDPESPPHVTVEPPPFQPPARGGCSPW